MARNFDKLSKEEVQEIIDKYFENFVKLIFCTVFFVFSFFMNPFGFSETLIGVNPSLIFLQTPAVYLWVVAFFTAFILIRINLYLVRSLDDLIFRCGLSLLIWILSFFISQFSGTVAQIFSGVFVLLLFTPDSAES